MSQRYIRHIINKNQSIFIYKRSPHKPSPHPFFKNPTSASLRRFLGALACNLPAAARARSRKLLIAHLPLHARAALEIHVSSLPHPHIHGIARRTVRRGDTARPGGQINVTPSPFEQSSAQWPGERASDGDIGPKGRP